MSGDHNDYLFGDYNVASKLQVKLSIRMYDDEMIMHNEYPDDVAWQHVVNDLIKTVEASYGYTFDIEDFGIYYKGKDDAE